MTALPESIVVGQLGHITDHEIIHSWVNDASANIVDARDFPDAVDAAAACSSGDALWLPGSTPYVIDAPLILPSGVAWLMPKGGKIRCDDPAAGVFIPDPRSDFVNLNVDGGGVSLLPLKVGDEIALTGTKSALWGIDISNVGVGGRCAWIINLQNSTGWNWRTTGAVNATEGFVIDYGTKNLGIYGFFSTGQNGPGLWLTTGGGAQQTSKVTVYYGLMEGNDGILLGDCELFTAQQLQLNTRGAATYALRVIADGNRDGTGAHAGNSHKLIGVGLATAGTCISVETGTTVQTDGCRLGGANLYKVEHALARIKEVGPNITENWTGARFVSVAGIKEQTAILRSVGPSPRPLTLTPTVWALQPAAVTEFPGVSRQGADLAQYRFARLIGEVSAAGAAGAKLSVEFRVTTTQIVNNGGASAGQFRLVVIVNGVTFTTTNIQWNAPATGPSSIQTKLEDQVGSGNVTVTGVAGGPWTAVFGDDLAGIDIPTMTTSADSTNGTGVTITQGPPVASTVELPLDAGLATITGEWGPIPDAAVAPSVLIVPLGLGGNGIANPAVASLSLEVS